MFLPSRLWLIGLGHLGQTYMWGLGLLPYSNPEVTPLFLDGSGGYFGLPAAPFDRR